MSKLFVYGTELEEFEQLMMLVPNFLPRKREVIVLKKIVKEEEDLGLKTISNYFTDISGLKATNHISNNKNIYDQIVRKCFEKNECVNLNKRITYLIKNDYGEIFLNQVHRSRFLSVCRLQNQSIEGRDSDYLATLFLLTADDKLWSAARGNIYVDSFDFRKMHLNGINTDGYAIYQMARTIYLGREYIKLDEIADTALIGNATFKVIIHAILIAKYGANILKSKQKEEV
jgi:hypothetical protein